MDLPAFQTKPSSHATLVKTASMVDTFGQSASIWNLKGSVPSIVVFALNRFTKHRCAGAGEASGEGGIPKQAQVAVSDH